MISAFGIDHGEVSKGWKNKVVATAAAAATAGSIGVGTVAAKHPEKWLGPAKPIYGSSVLKDKPGNLDIPARRFRNQARKGEIIITRRDGTWVKRSELDSFGKSAASEQRKKNRRRTQATLFPTVGAMLGTSASSMVNSGRYAHHARESNMLSNLAVLEPHKAKEHTTQSLRHHLDGQKYRARSMTRAKQTMGLAVAVPIVGGLNAARNNKTMAAARERDRQGS